MNIRFIRIFLLILIIIGLGLLGTQKLWVPSVVAAIMANDSSENNEGNTDSDQSKLPSVTVQHAETTPSVTPIKTTATTTSSPVPPKEKGTSTITGTITLSPTCPIERDPPDPACAPKAYMTRVDAVRNGTVVSSTQSGSNGIFAFTLLPGTYTLRAGEGKVYPRCTAVTVTVSDAKTIQADISCDTGIR